MQDDIDSKAIMYALIIALLTTIISFKFLLELLDKMFVFLVLFVPLIIIFITVILIRKFKH